MPKTHLGDSHVAMHCLLTGMSTATPDKSKAPGAKRQMVEKEVARAEDAEDETCRTRGASKTLSGHQ